MGTPIADKKRETTSNTDSGEFFIGTYSKTVNYISEEINYVKLFTQVNQVRFIISNTMD